MTAKKTAKARKTSQASQAKKVTPCTSCKSFTVTPARNGRGRFVATKAKQKSFKF